MPERAEIVAMLLRLLWLIVCGVTRLVRINNNTTRRKKDGQLMKQKQNSRNGSDQNVVEFLGDAGAVVIGVEAVGNQLSLLLRGGGGAHRVLRWNLRQGGSLDWFEQADGEFTEYPGSCGRRNAADFEFVGLELPPKLLGKDIRLCEIDCTATPNQAEWELRFLPSAVTVGQLKRLLAG